MSTDNKGTIIAAVIGAAGMIIAAIITVKLTTPSKDTTDKQNLDSSITTNPTLVKSIDYNNLRSLLANKRFQEADEETNKILLKLTGNDSFNSSSDAAQINCNVYQNIDSLWREYSKDQAGNSKYGFSSQVRIFHEAGTVRIH